MKTIIKLSLVIPINLRPVYTVEGLYTDKQHNLYVIQGKVNDYVVSETEFIKDYVNLKCSKFGEDHYIVQVILTNKDVNRDLMFSNVSGPKSIRPYQINCVASGTLKVPNTEKDFHKVFKEILSMIKVTETQEMVNSFYKFCGKLNLE